MVQFTPEQRNFLVMAHEKNKDTKDFFKTIVTKFLGTFPGSQVSTPQGIRKMTRKQNTFFTSHNLNSKDSPGTCSGSQRTVRTPLHRLWLLSLLVLRVI